MRSEPLQTYNMVKNINDFAIFALKRSLDDFCD